METWKKKKKDSFWWFSWIHAFVIHSILKVDSNTAVSSPSAPPQITLCPKGPATVKTVKSGRRQNSLSPPRSPRQSRSAEDCTGRRSASPAPQTHTDRPDEDRGSWVGCYNIATSHRTVRDVSTHGGGCVFQHQRCMNNSTAHVAWKTTCRPNPVVKHQFKSSPVSVTQQYSDKWMLPGCCGQEGWAINPEMQMYCRPIYHLLLVAVAAAPLTETWPFWPHGQNSKSPIGLQGLTRAWQITGSQWHRSPICFRDKLQAPGTFRVSGAFFLIVIGQAELTKADITVDIFQYMCFWAPLAF